MSIVKSITNDNKNYEHITKTYPLLQMKKGVSKKWKIKYINPDDEYKELDIKTQDETLIHLKKEVLKIKEKEFDYIRFILSAPMTEAIYTPTIFIINRHTKEIEEILKCELEVV